MWDSRKLHTTVTICTWPNSFDWGYLCFNSLEYKNKSNTQYECSQTTTNILLKWGCISEVSVGSETGNDKAFMFP